MSDCFADRLAAAVKTKANPLVVGLDPRWELLPNAVRQQVTGQGSEAELAVRATAYRDFCLGVLDVVAPLVPAVKPQVAFFEQLGWHGMKALAEVLEAARGHGLMIVADGKRNDIGSTAEGYAEGWLGANSPWGADALTISPYLGDDSLEPFVQTAVERQAGLFVLVKTSNPGGGFLQDIVSEGKTIYRRVADWVEKSSAKSVGECGYGAVGAVVGATYPEQLAELRQEMPRTWFLVPGFGSQGGTAADVAPAFDPQGLGALINSSRAILFAHSRPEYADRYGEADWQRAVEEATHTAIAALRDSTSAGQL